jgi:uncharacterized protein
MRFPGFQLAAVLLTLGAHAAASAAQTSPPVAGPPQALPESVVEEPITIGEAPWAVQGLLDRPKAAARAPAVVLMHGSGPGTRDMDVGPNKIFREIGWGLAARGVIVVRYDKRSSAHAARLRETGHALSIDEEFTDDAVAAVKLLLARPDVDPRRIYVVGSSQSCAVAPLVAERVPQVAGVVLLAAGGRTPAELIREQVAYSLGTAPPTDTAARANAQRMLAGVARMEDPTLPDSVRVFNRTLGYWRSMPKLEPRRRTAELLERGGRALVVHGGRDFLVTDVDFGRWRAELQGKPRITFRRYPELNHLMQAGEGKMRPDEYDEYRPVSPVLLRDLARWLKG